MGGGKAFESPFKVKVKYALRVMSSGPKAAGNKERMGSPGFNSNNESELNYRFPGSLVKECVVLSWWKSGKICRENGLLGI